MGVFDRIRDRFAAPKALDRAQPAVAEPQSKANARVSSPLDVRDAEGISARDRINEALMSVNAYKQARGPGEVPPSTMSPEFGHRAMEDVSAAWDDPAATKAMRAAGGNRIAMMDDVGRGKLDGVRRELSASADTPARASAPDPRASARDHWQKAIAAGADAAKVAQSARQSETQGKRATPRM